MPPTHLFLQQLLEGLLGFLFCVPLVRFLHRFRPFFDFNTENKLNITGKAEDLLHPHIKINCLNNGAVLSDVPNSRII